MCLLCPSRSVAKKVPTNPSWFILNLDDYPVKSQDGRNMRTLSEVITFHLYIGPGQNRIFEKQGK